MQGSRRSAVLYSLTAGAVAMAYAGDSAPDQRLALRPPRAASRVLATSAPSCPLPVGKQMNAVKAFAEMLPVFRHPRCLNCHGGVDPASPAHKGVDQLDPDIDRMTDREAYEEQCQTCHDGLPGWNTPGEPVFFVGKDDEELCMQMKRFEATGPKLVEHLENDHHGIQFIAAGFAGDRALGEQGMVDYSVVRERPPGTQAQLVQQAQKWVDMLGDGYQASPECGCVLPKITLQVQHQSVINPSHPSYRAGQVGFSGDANFEVTLAAVHEAEGRIWYKGEKSLVRRLQTYFAAQGCQGTASEAEEWLWSAEVDTASREMKLLWSFTTSDEQGQAVCNTRGHRTQMELEPSIFAGDISELVMPLDSGSTKEDGANEETGSARERLAVKVLGVP